MALEPWMLEAKARETACRPRIVTNPGGSSHDDLRGWAIQCPCGLQTRFFTLYLDGATPGECQMAMRHAWNRTYHRT